MLLTGVALTAVAGAVWYGWDYWTVGQYLVSTDDAYVQADNTTIAPKVSGYLHEVLVGDNEQVKAGQIAGADRRSRLQGRARPGQGRRRRRQSRDRQQAGPARGAACGDQCRQGDRRGRPRQPRPSPRRKTSATPTSPRPATAACRTRSRRSRASPAPRPRSQRDTANLASAVKQVDLLKAEIVQAEATLARAQAAAASGRTQSQLHHHHRADRRRGRQPHAAHRPVRAGRHPTDVGGAGQRRLCGGEFQGNPAHRRRSRARRSRSPSICSRARRVHGHVDSLAPASGQEFALLPPDNATGNFTKIVQRIPVKIALDGADNAPIDAAAGHVGDPDHRDPRARPPPRGRGRSFGSSANPRGFKRAFHRGSCHVPIQGFRLRRIASGHVRPAGARGGRSRIAPASWPGSPSSPR